MKEITLVYGKNCFESKKAVAFVDEISLELKKNNIYFNKVEFSFSNSLIKDLAIVITPTFIFNNKIIYIGTPEKSFLINQILSI